MESLCNYWCVGLTHWSVCKDIDILGDQKLKSRSTRAPTKTFNIPSTIMSMTLVLQILFHFLSYMLAPSLLLVHFLTESPIPILPSILATILISNIAAYAATTDQNIICTQFVYWLLAWVFFVNKHSKFSHA